MPKKPSGGRGKRETYSTSVVRVPDPIKPQILDLIEAFHQNHQVEVSKPVTGLPYQIPISVVAELLAAEEELGANDGLPPWISCPYPRSKDSWWDEECDENWERVERPHLERFNQFADQVNPCIWQIDNSFTISSPGDGYSALALLIEYRLIQFIDEKPASARQLIDWVFACNFRMDNVTQVASEAIEQKRFDILTALKIGQRHPVARHEYWLRKYTEKLAKTDINYWQWRDNPESLLICPELSTLLSMPEPPLDTRRVLECLAEGKDPFFKPEVKSNAGFLSFGQYLEMGKFGNSKPEDKQAYRQAFIQWHVTTLAQLGEDVLKNIYKVVYGCDWDLVQTITNPMSGEWWEVLGVPPDASPQEVKKAHRNLAKIWHPDINSSPIAKERMSSINQAFESYQQTCNRF